jgi:hypothetical protein
VIVFTKRINSGESERKNIRGSSSLNAGGIKWCISVSDNTVKKYLQGSCKIIFQGLDFIGAIGDYCAKTTIIERAV